MGGPADGNKRGGPTRWGREDLETKDRERISTGPNVRAPNEPIAGTAAGIPDDARAPGEKPLRKPPSEEEVEEAAANLGAPEAERDSLPLEGQ